MLQVGRTSLTEWVDELRRVPLYAIISGFILGDTPGVGTLYDFFARQWFLASPPKAGSSQNVIRNPSRTRRVKRPLLPHSRRWNDWSIGSCFVTLASNHCQPTSSCPCFVSSLYRSARHSGSSATYLLSPSQGMDPLCEPLPSLVASAFVTAENKASTSAPATASIHYPIATSVGTVIATAITLVITSIGSWPRTAIMTFHSILDWDGLAAMTPCRSS